MYVCTYVTGKQYVLTCFMFFFKQMLIINKYDTEWYMGATHIYVVYNILSIAIDNNIFCLAVTLSSTLC